MRLFGRGGILHPTLNNRERLKTILANSSAKVIVNVGSGVHKLAPNVMNLDLCTGSKIDVIGDGHLLPFQDSSIDIILLLAVLEHVKSPRRVIKETCRVLKKGGKVYCEFPFMQPEHNAPADYWRVTLEGLRHLFRGFKEVDAGICTGAGSTVAWVLIEYSKLIFKRRWLRKVIFLVTSILVSPLK